MSDLQTLVNCANASRGVIASVGRTHLLWRGVESLISQFVAIPTSQAGIELCRGASIPYCLPEDVPRRFHELPLMLLAFDSTAVPKAIAALPGCRLLASDLELVRSVENKLSLPLLLRNAGLPAIPDMPISSAAGADVSGIWENFGEQPIVIQTSLNNLTGTGTFLVRSREELRATLRKLPHGPAKAVQFIASPSYTVSGCVTSNGCIVSYPSKQLVGIKSLTNWWAAHCGNELLTETDISALANQNLIAACKAVGKVLCEQGFRGHFGLDVLLVGDLPYVIEINPRIQSVSSLVHAAELRARHIPLHLVHILEFTSVTHQGLAEDRFGASEWQYSQVIVSHLTGTKEVSGKLLPGCYRLHDDVLKLEDVSTSLPQLTDRSEFLITPFCWEGDRVELGDRIAVVQRCGAMTDAAGQLLPDVAAVVSLVRSAFIGD